MYGESALETFAAKQRERLEAIRKATDREKALLENKGIDASPPRRFASAPIPEYGSSFPVEPQSPHAAREYEAVASPSGSGAQHAREEGLKQLSHRLQREEDQLGQQEKLIDVRLSKAEEAKRELLGKLIALQYREQELKNRSQQLDEEEAAARSRQDEYRSRQREIAHQAQQLEHDLNERQAKLTNSKRRFADRQAEQSKVVQKLKQQLNEQEDKVRSVELQFSSRQRAVDDMERDLATQLLLQRDLEMSAIEELRNDIQRARTTFGL